MKHDKIDHTLPYERRYWPGCVVAQQTTVGSSEYLFYRVTEYRYPVNGDLIINPNLTNNPIHTQNILGNPSEPLWVVEKVPNYEVRTCTNIWDAELLDYLEVEPFEIRVFPDKPGENDNSYVNHAWGSYVIPAGYPVTRDPWRKCEFVNGNPADTIEYKFQKHYVHRYKIGEIVDISGKKYEIIDFAEPTDNSLWLAYEDGEPVFFVASGARNSQHRPTLGINRFIVVKVIDKPKYEIKTCTRIWDDSVPNYVDVEPFEIRVYNERPKSNAGDSGYLSLHGSHYVLPAYQGNFDSLDWKRCEFINGNPLDKEPLAFYTYYICKYKIGQVVTVNSKRYKITAFATPTAEQLCLMGEFSDNSTSYIMRGCSASPVGIYGRKRYLIEEVKEVWEYETGFKPGDIVTDHAGTKWEVICYQNPKATQSYIGVISRKDFIATFVAKEDTVFAKKRWIIKPQETEEEKFKNELRKVTPRELAQELIWKAQHLQPPHYGWLLEVVEERCK